MKNSSVHRLSIGDRRTFTRTNYFPERRCGKDRRVKQIQVYGQDRRNKQRV